MIIEVQVPQLSESVAEGTLASWKKKIGDAVARDEILIDIETDKVVLEVPSPADGVLVEIVKADGETVVSGELIARIDSEAKAGAAVPAAEAPKAVAVAVAAAPAPAAGAPAGTASPAARKILDEKGVVSPRTMLSTPSRRRLRPPVRSLRRPLRLSPCRRRRPASMPLPPALNSACRCPACAPVSPSVCCSRRRPTPS
jgi:pyruvate/2-oxoglutarate dehydrogenase complex dihydrolipoamide acyltransferase (E2) component